VKCSECGRDFSGNFCSHCGAPASSSGHCASCGSALDAEARFCAECGAAVAGPTVRKGWSATAPWILSGLALIAFGIAVSLFVRGQSGPRAAGMPPTGGILTGEEAPPSPGGGPGAGGMPTAAELAAMSPREAADRLFDRAMSTRESGDTTRASFFARMAVQAYRRVAPTDLDADAHFHIGLLKLASGDVEGAAREAEGILKTDPKHLLGLILGAQTAEARGDNARRREFYARFLMALPEERATGRQEYAAHSRLIEDGERTARALLKRP